jgi:hypothetical protein
MHLDLNGLYSPESLYRHAAEMLKTGAVAGERNAWVCHACQVAGRLSGVTETKITL